MADKATRTEPGPIDGSSFMAGNVTQGPYGSGESAMIHALRSALMLSNPSVNVAWGFYVDRRPKGVFQTDVEREVSASAEAASELIEEVEDANSSGLWGVGFGLAGDLIEQVGLVKAEELRPDEYSTPEAFLDGFDYAIATAKAVSGEHDDLEEAMTSGGGDADAEVAATAEAETPAEAEAPAEAETTATDDGTDGAGDDTPKS